jgi:hypothetical protein
MLSMALKKHFHQQLLCYAVILGAATENGNCLSIKGTHWSLWASFVETTYVCSSVIVVANPWGQRIKS